MTNAAFRSMEGKQHYPKKEVSNHFILAEFPEALPHFPLFRSLRLVRSVHISVPPLIWHQDRVRPGSLLLPFPDKGIQLPPVQRTELLRKHMT